MDKSSVDLLRELPAIDTLLENPLVKVCVENSSHVLVTGLLRDTIQQARERILAGRKQSTAVDWFVKRFREQWQELLKPFLKPVFNCTGVILHTGLGRAPLSVEARRTLSDAVGGYTNLEFNLNTGKRGQRNDHVEKMLSALTGAEAAVVVNNNAAAVYLSLNALANRKQVIVSRGQLVEIGGKFRVPDIMQRSGARLVEVGTTNKTHLEDYAEAVNDRTGMILRVHTSNFRQIGFVHQPELTELVELAQRNDIILVDDLGSGAFFDLAPYGLSPEPLVIDSVKAGVDVVTFSGDKLLGGSQAGILVGRKKWIDRIKRSPLMRVLRPDKLTLSVLEVTLRQYLAGSEAMKQVPVVSMLTESQYAVRQRAELLTKNLQQCPGAVARVIETEARCGSGALPEEPVASYAVELELDGVKANRLARTLREYRQPVVGYIHEEQFRMDLKAVSAHEVEKLAAAVCSCLQENWRK
jgi:L-seryl-tRNA(Ser) seleniumtransferase